MSAAANHDGPCEVCGRERSAGCTDFLRVRTVHGDQTQCAWCVSSGQRASVFKWLFGDATPAQVAVNAEQISRLEEQRRRAEDEAFLMRCIVPRTMP